MEQFILSALTRHMKDNEGIRPSQHGFMKGRSCLTNLISFCDQMTHLLDEEKSEAVSAWTFVRPLTLFPRESSWRN